MTNPPGAMPPLPDLLPCPFCGGPVQLEEANRTRDYIMGERRWWGVVCRNTTNLGGTCCMDQVPSASVNAAVTRWNTRAAAPLIARVAELEEERDRLNAIVNTPQADDFLRAVSTEAEHQRQRWGSEHDAGKTPADWFWLVGFLAGKSLHAHADGKSVKAEHHVITTAAALANWHAAITGKHTSMRPGIDGDAAIAAKD